MFSAITAYATTGSLIEVFYNVEGIVVDGVKHSLKQRTFIYNGSVYVPLRFVGESLEKKVIWDSQSKTVFIEEKSEEDNDNEIKGYELKISEIKEKLDLASKQLNNRIDQKNIKEILGNFKNTIGDQAISNVYFGKETGEMYCEPDISLPEDYDVRIRPWYSSAKKESEYVSEIYTEYIDNNQYITLAKAIYENDQFIGVVGVDLKVDLTISHYEFIPYI